MRRLFLLSATLFLENVHIKNHLFHVLRCRDAYQYSMWFSYEQNSMTNMFPVDAFRVKEILRMNARGVKCESLMPDVEAKSPEFVTSVGDDSISRFDDKGQGNGKRQNFRPQKNGGNNGPRKLNKNPNRNQNNQNSK